MAVCINRGLCTYIDKILFSRHFNQLIVLKKNLHNNNRKKLKVSSLINFEHMPITQKKINISIIHNS